MPNTFAYITLFIYPVVSLLALRNRPLTMSIPIAVFGAYLFLPMSTEFDLPILPPYEKNLAGVVAALLLIGAYTRNRMKRSIGPPVRIGPSGWLPKAWWVRFCLLGIVGGAFMTAVTNSEPLIYGPTVLEGMTLYAAFSDILSFVMMLLPLALGRRYLASSEGQRSILVVYAAMAGLYSLPVLFEARMSPQLHIWIYGFFQHLFEQHIRGGAFRPIVFLEHGLFVGIFLSMGFFAAISLAREATGASKMRLLGLAAFLYGVLFLSRNLGALIIATAFAPVLLLAPKRAQALIAAALVITVLIYPTLRGANLFPIDTILSWANAIDVERGASLEFRFVNEEFLLERAAQKPLFGWGGYGRNEIFNAAGRDISTVDGTWIILLGTGGWVRFLSTFLLLAIPVVLLTFHLRKSASDSVSVALAMITAANMIDLIPNSAITPLTWLILGSLIGRLEQPNAAWNETKPISYSNSADASHSDITGAFEPVLTKPQARFERLATPFAPTRPSDFPSSSSAPFKYQQDLDGNA